MRLGELDWRTIPKDADMLIGINMGDLVESDLARALLQEWTGRLGVTQGEQEKLLATLGSISQIVISVHGKDLVAVVIGRLDDLQEGADLGGLKVARLSPDTLAIGSQWNLIWVRHRLHFPLEETSMVKEARELAQTTHFWALAKPSAMAAFGQPANPNSPITKVKFGVSLQDRFRMDLFLDTTGPETAQRVLESSLKTAPRDLRASVEGASVHYALILDRAAMLARFSSFMSDSLGKQFAPLIAAAREIAAHNASGAAHPAGKVIIEGLDETPRQVPLGAKQ